MKTLTLRIYLTVVAALLLFAGISGWLFHREIESERSRADTMLSERMAAWGDLIQRSLPGDEAPAAEQAAALVDWSSGCACRWRWTTRPGGASSPRRCSPSASAVRRTRRFRVARTAAGPTRCRSKTAARCG